MNDLEEDRLNAVVMQYHQGLLSKAEALALIFKEDTVARIIKIESSMRESGAPGMADTFSLRVYLSSGEMLLIIHGPWSYSSKDGLYEMGYFKGGELVKLERWGDQVMGHLEEFEVENEIKEFL